MTKKQKIQTNCENPIEEIKSRISNCTSNFCKAEVYETWQNIFEEDE